MEEIEVLNFLKINENLINEFNEYLKENNLKISTIPIVNENYINNYLMSIFYNLYNNIDSSIQIKNLENNLFNILKKYCEKMEV